MSLYTVTIEDRIYKVNISGDHCTVNGEAVDATMMPLNRNGPARAAPWQTGLRACS